MQLEPSVELLAPAGNWDCARAAIENGADAVYFGLDVGFNARARADNFHLADLPGLMHALHRQAVRGYVTLNTLVFTDELASLEENVRRLAEAGVDAVLVQDLGAARLIREICPELPLHASTQMTLTNAAAIAMAAELGIERVVLARELSLREIGMISRATEMPLEVFVHGALCVAYSGQCLTSESFGGRSANRGQCAQACRLPYDVYRDGELVDLQDVRYVLSPQDLAAHDLVPELIAAGVCSLKIEGRLKTPEYVAGACQQYRQAIDAALAGAPRRWSAEEQRDMELSFSRGFSPGWLEGCDHKRLVPGLSSAKRGVRIGKVLSAYGDGLAVELTAPLAVGDGIVIEGDRYAGNEVGGRVYELFQDHTAIESTHSGEVKILLQRGALKDKNITAGLAVWKTDDPRLTKRLRQSFANADPQKRVPIDVRVVAKVGQPLLLSVQVADAPPQEIVHEHRPEQARKHALTIEVLREQFSRLGGSVFELRELTADIAGEPMVPLSVLGAMRRDMLERLEDVRRTAPLTCAAPGVTERLLAAVGKATLDSAAKDPGAQQEDPAPSLRVLCRSLEQLESALEAGARRVVADFQDIRQYAEAVRAARSVSAHVELATLRIHKPGEDGLFRALAKSQADAWLVRNLAAMRYCQQNQVPFACDFSLNVTNPLTAEQLLRWGAQRVTASYDLNRDQLVELVRQLQPGGLAAALEVVVHQHMPMFHMEHCVFCSVLSPGKNKSDCGRPCDRHAVQLRDRVGELHVLHADIGCRNTLYNGVAQSGAEAVAPLLSLGVRQFRIELLRDAPRQEVGDLVRLYSDLLAGSIQGAQVWQQLKAHNRVGVTRGTLEQARNPLAIL